VSDLPAITGRRLIKALKKLGFEAIRSKDSHHFLRHADGRCTTVPVHAGETIGRGLPTQIRRDCEISLEDLRKVL
jgi:predicted RNA binding protein YcfA (HicA-like mRNA interferase family)